MSHSIVAFEIERPSKLIQEPESTVWTSQSQAETRNQQRQQEIAEQKHKLKMLEEEECARKIHNDRKMKWKNL